jgi:two-component system, OmpR family, sensor kinase
VSRGGSVAGWSLGARLARRILLATGVVWCLVLGAGLAVMWHEMREITDDALADEARYLARMADLAGPAPVQDGGRGARVRIIRPGAAPPAAPWPPLEADGSHDVGGWTVVRATAPGEVVVEVGQATAALRGEFWEAARVWLFMTVPLLGLLLVVVVRTVRGALAPVAAFAGAVDGRRASDLSPTPEDGLPAELRPIPRALNRYLGRIDALLASERDFSANAAHELRTPLAVASAQAQLLAEGRAGPKAAEAVVAAVERLTAMVERLLALARAEAEPGRSGERCDLVQVLRMLVEEAPRGSVRFDDGDMERLEVAADADSVALLLGNLLRNACEHGSGTVRATLGPGPSVEISNPVAPGAAFAEGRFARGAGSAGSGLGLAIARATAMRFGWGLDLSMRDGVARARVDFRAAEAPKSGWPGSAPRG